VPEVELLDDTPLTLTRPLALVDGIAYAAAWPWVRTVRRESLNKAGDVVRHDPPLVETERVLVVVRGDGTVFGPGSGHPIDSLGLALKLADPPRDGKGWSTPGVKRYHAGARPDAADVLRRVAGVYDAFIDFAHSFADQRALCELSALFSLQTWFAPAYTVLGYPWPNGERGTGKTQWGTCWANTSYLGEVLLSSGSFAALRDLAAYGAALLFDDAEILSDPKRCDPQKRELFLAGNRRGASVALKEQQPDGTWQTRWVSAFCPRGFTAINLPDQVLASRSIILPLARTADPRRGNRDPGDLARWPCDQQALQDDCYALALALLPEAADAWAELDAEESCSGREFEPWRALVAVARLLERQGVDGLEARLRATMAAYQEEKTDLLDGDRTVWAVRAVHAVAFPGVALDALDTSTALDALQERVPFTSNDVCDAIKKLAEESEVDAEWANPSRVGHVLKRLRLKRERENTAKRRRLYVPTKGEVLALGRAYGVLRTLPAGPAPLPTSVQGVPSVQSVQAAAGGPEVFEL
jgi:hypothetical protein